MVQHVIPGPGRLKRIWALEQDLVSQPLYRGEMRFSEQKSKPRSWRPLGIKPQEVRAIMAPRPASLVPKLTVNKKVLFISRFRSRQWAGG